MTSHSYSELVYARGFILGKRPPIFKGKNWETVDFAGWVLSYDEVMPAAHVKDGWDEIFLLGNAIDPEAKSALSNRQISETLLSDAQSSRDQFQATLDRLIGRFVVFLSVNGATSIQQDATSMRAVYYADNQYETTVGSHIGLVAASVGARSNYFGQAAYMKDNRTKVHPGVTTSHLGINRLTPNTELHLETRAVSRVFPRRPVKHISAYSAAHSIIADVDAQIRAFQERGTPLMCSLSAGLDSRVSLALLRPYIEHVTFFTYDIGYMVANNANRWDRDTALELVQKHGLRHKLLHLPERATDAGFLSVMRRNTVQTHQRTLAKAYLDDLPGDHLHIRSNVYEIGRNYYRHAGFDMDTLDGAGMLEIVSNRRSADRPSIDAFEHYKNLTRFDDAVGFGYDPLDLFYWENRMGVWMAPILHESDVAHDTHILLNSRSILETLLSVDLAERDNNTVFMDIIKLRWPELLETPINGVSYLEKTT